MANPINHLFSTFMEYFDAPNTDLDAEAYDELYNAWSHGLNHPAFGRNTLEERL